MTGAASEALADELYWLQVDTKLGLAVPDWNNFVGFWMLCRPEEGGKLYRGYLDLQRHDADIGETVPITVDIGGEVFRWTGTGIEDGHDRDIDLATEISSPERFLTALAQGTTVTFSAAGESLTTDLDGAGPLVTQLREACERR